MSSAEISPEERARLLEKYPAMDHDYHTDSVAYDQIAAAVGPETNAFGQVKEYSPQAWWHPEIVEKLEAARAEPTTIPSGDWLRAQGFGYAHSNLPDRKPMEAQYGPDDWLDPTEECGHDLSQNQVIGIDHTQTLADYRLGVENAITGPFGLRTVRLVAPEAPLFAPPLPLKWTEDGFAPLGNGGDNNATPTQVALPVPPGWTTERVARMAVLRWATECAWKHLEPSKDERQAAFARGLQHRNLWSCEGTADMGLLVSCGSTTFVFPTCMACGLRNFPRDATRDSWLGGEVIEDDRGKLDHVTVDGWDKATGFPADRHR